jgi:hypothetical protein
MENVHGSFLGGGGGKGPQCLPASSGDTAFLKRLQNFPVPYNLVSGSLNILVFVHHLESGFDTVKASHNDTKDAGYVAYIWEFWRKGWLKGVDMKIANLL